MTISKPDSVLLFRSTSPEATLKFAADFAADLKPNDVIALTGSLGAGKTHFVKGIARGLGFKQTEITSPTFTLIQEYRETGARLPLYHLDFYRLENNDEVADIGIDEILESGGITIIEWADKFPQLVPSRAKWINLELEDNSETTRLIFSK